MPRPRPPYLLRESKRGKTAWYVRKGAGKRIRIRGEYGSPEFMEAYHKAVAGEVVEVSKSGRKATTGSLSWLVERYRESAEWRSLSLATKQKRERIYRNVVEKAGNQPASGMTRKLIVAGREARAETPSQARHFLGAMRGLFRWAEEAGLVDKDPTLGVKNPKRPKSEGFEAWSEEEVQRYEQTWPRGTKERVWLDVLLYTGLRRGDAVRLGRQHVSDGVVCIRTEKSGGQMEVVIPILPALEATLDAGSAGDLTFIYGETGRRLKKESFGNFFRVACQKARVEKSAHGVRKIGATRAANAGATEAELEVIFGWTGGKMASLYT